MLGGLAAAITVGFAVRLRGVRWGIALGLILGGAVGNLVDRIMNPPSFGQGHVTDFIAYGDLFVGNIADILVVSGVALLCLIMVTSPQPDQHELRDVDSDHDSPNAQTDRSEEHTSELQSLMRISYAVFCLKKKKKQNK